MTAASNDFSASSFWLSSVTLTSTVVERPKRARSSTA